MLQILYLRYLRLTLRNSDVYDDELAVLRFLCLVAVSSLCPVCFSGQQSCDTEAGAERRNSSPDLPQATLHFLAPLLVKSNFFQSVSHTL